MAETAGAVVVDARIAAAHDGLAELIVTVGYGDGSSTEVALDGVAGAALMESCGARALDDLNGASWEKVRDALRASYNRFC